MPDRLMPTIWFQDSTDTSRKLRRGVLMPALLTRMSMCPCRFSIAAAALATSFWSETSSAMASPLPAALSCFSLAISVSLLRPEITTCAPARANSSAPASPMPEPPPVIQATLPFRELSLGILRCTEQVFLLLLGHLTGPARVLEHFQGAFDRRALEERVAPALERRELLDVHALPLGKAQPGHRGHVGDRVLVASHVFAFRQLSFKNTIKAIC